MSSSKVSEFFQNIKKYQSDIDDNFDVPPIIKPTLLSYQRKAVKWMIECEKNNTMITSKGSKLCGGILADQMGLGKTVEMLCCIMANLAPAEFCNKKIKVKEFQTTKLDPIPSSTPSTSKYVPYSGRKDLDQRTKNNTREMLNNWYKQQLNSMSTTSPKQNGKKNAQRPFDNDLYVECYCTKTPRYSTLVFCAMCGKGQHAECVHFQPNPFQEVPFLCANCWIVNDKLHCKATLIVVPQSILNQWINEIKNHIEKPGLKVLIYNGVHFDGYVQPITFIHYDIVITSYQCLAKDINFLNNFDCEGKNITRLRHSKKYYYPKSPLPCIKWWRICLDEGQAIENTNCKVFEMAAILESVNKWAMTGTPIQKSVHDLFGILKFLDASPYCVNQQFQQLLCGDAEHMYSWFSKIIWRNLLDNVNSELNIPRITHEQHKLTISHIEKHFYESQRIKCANDFLAITTKLFPSLNVSVQNIDKRTIYKIIRPLYRLRQACVHPQAVNGQFLKIKGTMTMENLMDLMIDKCRTECNDVLRSLISQHNARAGLFLILQKHDMSVQDYMYVLDLIQKYKDKKLKVDTCQRIHVLYNLTSIISEYGHEAVRITSDDIDPTDMKKSMEQLENEYLDSSKQNIEKTNKIFQSNSDKIDNVIGKKTLKYSSWWSDILDWIYPQSDFLTNVQIELEDYKVPGVPSISNKLKSINAVYNLLDEWLADLDSARKKTITVLKKLEEIPMNNLVLAALACHLRVKSAKVTKDRCLLCQAESQLRAYESLLFCVTNKQKNRRGRGRATNVKDDEIESEITTTKGHWKMSQKELLLIKLFQYGQAKIINENCLKDAAEHMKILELVRKEFKYLRLLWADITNGVSAHDEIVMAKSTIKFEDFLKPEIDENGPPKKKAKKNNDNNFDNPLHVELNIKTLNSEVEIINNKLEQQIRTLLFLENIKKEKENPTEAEQCPICQLTTQENTDLTWSVFQCGHSVCFECLAKMCNRSANAQFIECPMCRVKTPMDAVSYVKPKSQDQVPSIVVKGSCSTKIESITSKLLELIADDPLVKVIIFSTWEKALSLLGEALNQNSINFRVLKTGNHYKKTLNEFKTDNKINAILMQLSLGAKGLNLTEATRIFFMEPILNKADELQAIGRIYRIGQIKPTFVHHFISEDTIEENIVNLFAADKLRDWEDITLSELIKVFGQN